MDSKPDIFKKTKKLSLFELFSYSLGNMAVGAIELSVALYITYYWTDIFLIPLGAISMIFLLSRFEDGFDDLLIGFWIDRTTSKHGKARPWLVRMLLPATISVIMLFYVPDFNVTGRIIYAAITYNMVAFLYLTAIQLPLQSLTSLMTNNPKERLTLSMAGQAFIVGISVIGNLYFQKAIQSLGGGEQGYFRFFFIVGIVAGILVLTAFFGTKEKVSLPSNENNSIEKIKFKEGFKLLITNKWWVIITILMALTKVFPALMAINIYYMIWVMKDSALMGPFMAIVFLSMFITLVIGTPLINRFGKINAGVFAMCTLIIGALLPLFAPQNIVILMISAICRGIGPSILVGTRYAFMGDVADYGEWKSGKRIDGLVFSGASFGGKVGTGIGSVIVTIMLGWGGYVGGAAAQSAAALNAITFTFTWISAIFSLATTICLLSLRGLEKEMLSIRNEN